MPENQAMMVGEKQYLSMIQLSTIEITSEGNVTAFSTPKDSVYADLFPTTGGNIMTHWDEETNLEMEGNLKEVFSSNNSIEFTISLNNHSFQCTAYQHAPQRALLHFKLIKIISNGKFEDTEERKIDDWLNLEHFVFKKTSMPIIVGLEDGRFLDVNDTALALYGYSWAEMMQLKTDDLRVNKTKSYAQLWEEVKTQKQIKFQSIHKKKDGTLMEVDIVANYFNYEGREVSCTFITDITERKSIEAALRRSNERYENASIATSDVVWEWDLTTDSNYYSQNFTRLFGHAINSLQYVIENSWRKNLHPEDKEHVLATEAEVVNGTNDKWEIEYRLKKSDGEYAIVLDRGFSIKDESGKVIKLIGAMQDITKRKEAEYEKIQLLTELAANNKELLQFSYITTQPEGTLDQFDIYLQKSRYHFY